MIKSFESLLSFEFVPLSEAKAKLSEQVRWVTAEGKRIGITCNGKPAAVLMSYQDYLDLVRASAPATPKAETRIYDFQEWKKGKTQRAKVKESIAGLFEAEKLSRKGQKKYKEEAVRELRE